jgi:molybdopterin converting factor small subunit
MKVVVKLFAVLETYLAPDARDHSMELELAEGATPEQVVARLHIPDRLASLVLLNGRHLTRAEREHLALHEGDVVAIVPPIAGG